jgi:hypothetical protein
MNYPTNFITDVFGNTIVVVTKEDKIRIYETPMDYVVCESFNHKVKNHMYFEAPVELLDAALTFERPTYKSLTQHLTLLKKQL